MGELESNAAQVTLYSSQLVNRNRIHSTKQLLLVKDSKLTPLSFETSTKSITPRAFTLNQMRRLLSSGMKIWFGR